MDIIYDFKLIDMNTNEVVMEGETASIHTSSKKPKIKIIETNLMLDKKLNNFLNNFQSRVIEVDSWEYVIEQFTSEDIKYPKSHFDIFNGYCGAIVPRMAQIENLEYDDYRLTCDVIFNKKRIRKLIQRY